MKKNNVLICIDKGKRSSGYVKAAKKLNVNYKIVDCNSSHVFHQIEGATALIWHWRHDDYKEKRTALSIIKSIEDMGIEVYPNTNTCWHFDDKLKQKYLLESISAPLAKTYVFFDKKEALDWFEKCSYPVVYKLTAGAGSQNVRLIHNIKEGKKICNAHFGLLKPTSFGFYKSVIEIIKDRNEIFNSNGVWGSIDKGYLYLQEFIPDNLYDIRVSIINEKAVIFRRYVRKNDFRASGSGKIDYGVSKEDLDAIIIARRVARQIKAQTMAFDFVKDKKEGFKIVEISYGFVSSAVAKADGWYNDNMEFIKEKVIIEEEIVKQFVEFRKRGEA